MKKLLLVGAIALFGAVNAQTQKGTWMLSGKTELSFNSAKTKLEVQGNNFGETKTTTVSLSPAASYFVIDNLAVGLGLSYTSQKIEDQKSNTFAILPQATYFFPVNGEVKPFIEAGIGYATNKTTIMGEDANFNGLAYGFGAGVAYFINPNVAFNLGVNYSAANLKYKENSDLKNNTNNIGVGLGISVFLK